MSVATPVALWLRGDLGITLNGANVSAWADQGPDGRDFAQGTAGDQPLFEASSINSLPGLRFDSGNDEFLDGPTFADLIGAEAFLVGTIDNQPPLTTTDSGLWAFGSGTQCFIPYTDDIIYDDFMTDTRKTTIDVSSLDMTSPFIYNVTSITGEWTSRMNVGSGLSEIFTTAVNTVDGLAATRIGKNSTTGPQTWDGQIVEVIIYKSKLSVTDRAAVNAYLESRYAI